MSLWEAAFLGCLHSTRYNKMITTHDLEQSARGELDNDNDSDIEGVESRKSSRANRNTTLSAARAEQVSRTYTYSTTHSLSISHY